MALCAVPDASGNLVLVPVDPSQCTGIVGLSSAEYVQFAGRGYITSREDADAIATAFILLLAIAAGVKAVRRALDSDRLSDEAH